MRFGHIAGKMGRKLRFGPYEIFKAYGRYR